MSKLKASVKKYLANRTLEDSLIKVEPSKELKFIVVVPCYKEKLSDLLNVCQCLSRQERDDFEVVIVVNNRIDDEIGRTQNEEVLSSVVEFQHLSFDVFFIDKTKISHKKKHGVGFARKLGMDEAAKRFDKLDVDGLIVCLDADCLVADDYLNRIEAFFLDNQKTDAVSIGYKHQEGRTKNEDAAIENYELHLRYYIDIQQWCNLPFAIHTVGSSMAVRSMAYCAQGGMPILQAGEDFYFLHKFIKNNSCGRIETPLVFPSSRKSDRVPFGTGKAVRDIIKNASKSYLSYNPESFYLLKEFLQRKLKAYPKFSELNEKEEQKDLFEFFTKLDYDKKIQECKNQTSDSRQFQKRFYQWFDAFALMKYLHHMRDKVYPNMDVLDCYNLYLQKCKGKNGFENTSDALKYQREIDYNSM